MTALFVDKIGIWIKALRAPFFTASLVPVILGGAVAFARNGMFDPFYFFLTMIGVLSLHAGGNMLNDYFDFKSGADVINETPTPFSGGSRVLVDGLLTPRSILLASIFSVSMGLVIGGFLAFKFGLVIIALGVSGVLLSILYSAPPFKLVYRGLGEVVVAIAFGPLIVFGSFYVQTGVFSTAPILASLPVSLLITAVLYINEFPDYEADKKAGKDQLVVILGTKKAVTGYGLIIVCAYLSILVGILSEAMPTIAILGLLTFPKAKKAYVTLKKNHNNVQNMLPANAMTINIHLQTGLLLSLGYLASAYV